jgi:mRNA-degrading endonuclease RelE of RelBE toxin-antitoxin system
MKEWLKVFAKIPAGYQKHIGDTIELILAWKTQWLDIDDMGKWEFRCRIGKYRIKYVRNPDWSYEVTKLWTRWDVYKK